MKFIQPEAGDFVITYARSLDDQQNSGILQGKAGSEFRLLKWQIIFPVLLQNHHVVFNRLSFLVDVISRIASHYNLTVTQIVDYLYKDTDKKEYPASLRKALRLLWEKIHEQKEHRSTLPPDYSIENLRKRIQQKTSVTDSERNIRIQHLASPLFRWKLINRLTENEHHQLLEFIIPSNSRFIIAYAKGLDRQPVKGVLQGKAGSGFTRIKWEFIYRILLLTRQHVFNKTYFVESTLAAISRHYNVPVTDLINYFLQDKDLKNHLFPDELIRIQEKLTLTTGMKKEHEEKTFLPFTISHYSYIENAGLVLLSPFLPLLFSRLSLLENGDFSSDTARLHAVWLLQYITYTENIPPGTSLYLNYLLTGLGPEIPVCEMLLPGQEQKKLVKSLQESVLMQWKKLKGTSIDGLQQAFLQRSGKIEEKEDAFYLYVEEKAYDMLLDTVPWNYHTVKTSWMDKPIYVKWR
ncbi:MAG: hypothetical protein LUH15_08685 [Tannerellaceae bacterium]|nr:hypothetical protein [Tannerellaceae bacterium]